MNAEMFAAAKDRIQRGMVASNVPAMAVAVAQNGKIIWEEGFGWADRERRIAATPHTTFCLASVSKSITATGLMVLVEQGKVDLDAPINEYLSRDSQLKVWLGDPKQVTVRRVANHTSGLPGHIHFYSGDETKPPAEESIRRYGNITSLPGERYRYSNFGYGILDHLIARVSGMTYDDFLRWEVFLPLGMFRSAAIVPPEMVEFAAVRYNGETGAPIPYYFSDHAGASEVYTSAHDLARFGMFHLGQLMPDMKPIMSEKLRQEMQIPTAKMLPVNLADMNMSPNSCYGVGWVIDEDDIGLRISHAGGMGGVATKITLFPREGIVVAAVANSGCRTAWTIERDITSALLPGFDKKWEGHLKWREELTAAQKAAGDWKPVPELMGDWEGTVYTYAGDFPITLSFKESGDIHAKFAEQRPTLVTDVRFSDNRLSGGLAGRINTPDATRRPWHPYHHIALDLKLRGDLLNGSAIAVAGNSLHHWAELRRKK